MSAPVARGHVLAQRATALLIDLTAVAATPGLAMLVFALVFGMHLGVAAIASAAAALGIFGINVGALVVLAVSLALVIAGSIAFARRDLVWHTDRMRAGRPAGPVPRPETFALKAASGLRAADSPVGMSRAILRGRAGVRRSASQRLRQRAWPPTPSGSGLGS